MNESQYWNYEDYLEACDAAEEQHRNDMEDESNEQ